MRTISTKRCRARRALIAAALALLILGLLIQLLAQFEPEDLRAPAKPSALVFANVGIVDVREGGRIIPRQ